MMICDWVAVVVGFVVGGGFFLLIVVGSGVGCVAGVGCNEKKTGNIIIKS